MGNIGEEDKRDVGGTWEYHENRAYCLYFLYYKGYMAWEDQILFIEKLDE